MPAYATHNEIVRRRDAVLHLRAALGRSIAALCCCMLLMCGVGTARAAPPAEGAFAAAAIAPPDAQLLLRLRGIKELRADGTLLPAQAALARLAGSRVLGDAWGKIAAELETDGAGLIDLVLGSDAVYLERTREGAVEWCIVTRMEQPVYDLLVTRLKPSIEGGGRVTFAPQQVAAAWRSPYLILGGAPRRAMMDEVLARIEATAPMPSLAEHPDLALLRGWNVAPIEVLWRHDAPIGGTTAFSARAAQGEVRMRHRSRWDKSPLHIASGAAADAGILRALAPNAIATVSMNPWRGPLDPGEPLDALLLEGQIDDAMRANLGARQVLVFSERRIDGTRLQVPTIGIALEVRDAVLAQKQWDGWARRLVESLARRVGQEHPPEMVTGSPEAPRSVAVQPLVRALFDDHPLLRATELAWTTASTPNGAWQFIASDPALLGPMVQAIAAGTREPDPDGAHELGVLSGRALAGMLRAWGMEAALLAPETSQAFAQSVAIAADIATAAQQVRWRAKAPQEGVVESEIVIALPAPAPAPTEPAPTEPAP